MTRRARYFPRGARPALALALLAVAGCGGGKPATAPLAAPDAVAAGRVARLRVTWGEQPDQERYRAGVEAEARAALARAGWRLDAPDAPEWTLRIDRVAIETPFENFGTPAPGESRTPMVRVRPRAAVEAKLLRPGGAAAEATGMWAGVFNAADPDAYRDLAFSRAAARVAERVTGVMNRAAGARPSSPSPPKRR